MSVGRREMGGGEERRARAVLAFGVLGVLVFTSVDSYEPRFWTRPDCKFCDRVRASASCSPMGWTYVWADYIGALANHSVLVIKKFI